jgi:hypothetical protein
MKTKTYKFKENKISLISSNIGVSIFITSFLLIPIILVLSLFTSINAVFGIGCFLISLPITLICLIISNVFNKKDNFTKDFIQEIKYDLSKAKNQKELWEVYDKLWAEAVDESNMIRLSYPLTIKELFKEINYKIDILDKQKCIELQNL